MGTQIKDQKVIGYACTWLSWVCSEMGELQQAVRYGERAQEICKFIPSDHYLFFKSLGGIGLANYFMGNSKGALDAGSALLDYGRRYSNIRSSVMGHWLIGYNLAMKDDYPSAIEACKKGVQTAQDPLYSQFPRYSLGTYYLLNDQLQKAEETLLEVAAYSRDFGDMQLGTPNLASLGLVYIAKGRMGQGLNMIKEAQQAFLKNQRRFAYAAIECYLGMVYLQIIDKPAKVNLNTMVKNIGFILKNVPTAAKKGVNHFAKAIEVAKEIGAKKVEGRAYLGLGLLHRAKARNDEARDCFSKAVRIFEKCQAEKLLKQTNDALESLE
jgi:tetratricopeptide (TPR) repeat protein